VSARRHGRRRVENPLALGLLVALAGCPGSAAVDAGGRDPGPGPVDASAEAAILDRAAPDRTIDAAVALDRTGPPDRLFVDQAATEQAPADQAVAVDAAVADAMIIDAGAMDSAAPDAASPQRTRALQWVRDHPMFISGLTVMMSAPSSTWVHTYFDGFHATAAHLWQTGLPDEVAGWAAAGHADFRFVSWVDQAGHSSANGLLLGGLTSPPAGRIGYQLWDEPRDYAQFTSLRAGYDALRAADPGALLILNHMTSADEVERMCVEYLRDWGGDILSYDAYTRGDDAYGKLALFRRVALAHGAPYWRYLKGYYDKHGDEPLDASDLRWDALSGAVYGYTGHTWFLYQIEPTNADLDPAFFEVQGDYASASSAEWAVAAQLNVELAHLGRALALLTSTDVRYRPSYSLGQPEETADWTAGAGGDPYLTAIEPAPGELLLELLIGFFVDDVGETYAMVQNVRHAHGDWPVNSSDPGTVRLEFDFGTAPVDVSRSAVLQLDQLSGDVVEKALTPLDADRGRLDVELAAGDVFFFKYKTGRPFALQP
jgi:hypothetical protein